MGFQYDTLGSQLGKSEKPEGVFGRKLEGSHSHFIVILKNVKENGL